MFGSRNWFVKCLVLCALLNVSTSFDLGRLDLLKKLDAIKKVIPEMKDFFLNGDGPENLKRVVRAKIELIDSLKGLKDGPKSQKSDNSTAESSTKNPVTHGTDNAKKSLNPSESLVDASAKTSESSSAIAKKLTEKTESLKTVSNQSEQTNGEKLPSKPDSDKKSETDSSSPITKKNSLTKSGNDDENQSSFTDEPTAEKPANDEPVSDEEPLPTSTTESSTEISSTDSKDSEKTETSASENGNDDENQSNSTVETTEATEKPMNDEPMLPESTSTENSTADSKNSGAAQSSTTDIHNVGSSATSKSKSKEKENEDGKEEEKKSDWNLGVSDDCDEELTKDSKVPPFNIDIFSKFASQQQKLMELAHTIPFLTNLMDLIDTYRNMTVQNLLNQLVQSAFPWKQFQTIMKIIEECLQETKKNICPVMCPKN